MTSPSFALHGASFTLPDGRCLFPPIDLRLDARPTGIVGRNGVGKSVLARLLAGEIAPTLGHVECGGRVHYVPQHVAPAPGATVADLAGLRGVVDALARIAAGRVDPADFDAVGERWDLHERFAEVLDAFDVPAFVLDRPAATLSGGECVRVALAGAWLADADLLVLDEPTHHLDRMQRTRWLERLQAWTRGLVVVSHDRELLGSMQRILAVSPAGVHDHDGDYAAYAAWQAAQREQAVAELDQAKLERLRGVAAMHEQRERAARRSTRGAREARDANQAPILLGGQRQRSEASAGRRERERGQRHAELEAAVADAAARVDDDVPVALFAPVAEAASRRVVARLEGIVLPYGVATHRTIDLVIGGTGRIGVTGPNGSGKSSLLGVLAGLLEPLDGVCAVNVPVARLDQRLGVLDPHTSPLDHLLAANPATTQAEARTKLALLGLPRGAVDVPAGRLSGGERLKTALAGLLYAAPAPGLLLLDEPTHHLDLPSALALEHVLRAWRGALVVVSHDEAFLSTIGLDTRVAFETDGVLVMPW